MKQLWAQYVAPWLRARRAFLYGNPWDVSFWVFLALIVGFLFARLP